MSQTSEQGNALLDRRGVVAGLLAERNGAIVVGGLGASTYDVAAAGDHDRNFYLWGAMGGAVMIGLGIALAQPKLPVVVITGDGEMLMGMGSLATVGLQQPANLTIVVLDNERLWRDRRTGQPHRAHRRPRRRRARLRDRGCPRAGHHGRDRGLCARNAGRRRAGRALPASRSTAPTWNACSPAATASTW